jgi:predicted RNase H-like nuclease (RuvC/YqgF family)
MSEQRLDSLETMMTNLLGIVGVTNKKLVETNERMAEGFERMEKRFEQMDMRFDAMDRRFDAMDKRFERIENRLDSIEDGMYRVNQIEKRLDHHVINVNKLQADVEILQEAVNL